MEQKKFGAAEKLLNDSLPPEFINQPACADTLAQRVELMGRQGRWPEAIADATLVLKYQPNDHYGYHTLAALLVITHDRPDYEQLCRRILPLFANTTNPYIAERMADDCLLLPQSGVDLQQVDRLATTAVTIGNDNLAMGYGYFQACKALSEYRLGHFSEAMGWAEKSLKTPQLFAQAKAYAVLAMAQWQLGQKDAAKTILAKGDTLAPRISPRHDTVDLGNAWLAWLYARILLDEADALIQPAATAQNNLDHPSQE